MRALLVLSLAATLAVAAGCSEKNNNPTGTAQGTIRMSVTDATGPFDAVHLVVDSVEVHGTGADTVGGWEVLRADSTTFDLVQLQNGVMAPLATGMVPAGTYHMIRLMLGPGSTVVVNGVSHPLVIPSGLQSGLKLVTDFTVPAGGATDLVLDFNANQSVVETGSGTFILNPVVRVQVASQAGAIRGTVLPDSANADVWAITHGDSLAHTRTATDGRFTLAALPVGTYTVAIHPHALGLRDTTVANVAVTATQTTDLGTIQLTPGAPHAVVSARLRR
jgi:hypothetical protein